MAITLNKQVYYRTNEVCEIAGISKPTLMRWLKNGVLEDSFKRDRRNWRLFTKSDVERVSAEATKTK